MHGPLDRLGDDVSGSCATEYSHHIQVGEWCDARTDPETGGVGSVVVGAVVRCAVIGDAKPGRGAGYMAAVTIAVERIRIRHRNAAGRSEEHTSELQSRQY